MKSSFLVLVAAFFLAGTGAGLIVGFGLWGSEGGEEDVILSGSEKAPAPSGGAPPPATAPGDPASAQVALRP